MSVSRTMTGRSKLLSSFAASNTAFAPTPIQAPNNGDWTQIVSETPEGGYRMGNPDAPVKFGHITIQSGPGAILGLPFGGAKGGVQDNPRLLSRNELQQLTRRYTQAIRPISLSAG